MVDYDANKKYDSFKIPARQNGQGHVTVQTSLQSNPPPASVNLSDGMFYEIDYDSHPVPGVGKFVRKAQAQKIEEPENDDLRKLFGQMRDIARKLRAKYDYSRFFDRRTQNENSAIFYQQALFMKDFTDDYEGYVRFSQYFPYYQLMGYEQLRSYFTWRTKVRQGNITETSLSYAFLYIYELLSNIGVSDPNDGLDKLMSFWKSFGNYTKLLDSYIIRWLKDYHVYYELPQPFDKFVRANDLADYYPELKKTDDTFDLFCSISKYNIKNSTFFNDSTSQMISDCFSFVLEKIRLDFEAAGMNFDSVLFRPTRKLSVWKPFKDALFYNWLKQPDRRVILSANEIYMCRNNEWTYSANITTEKGRQFIGYVMKRMESDLRKISKYKFKLTAKIDMINDDTIRILNNAGLFIEKVIPAAVAEYYKEANKTIVTVDAASLARIRMEALATQEALIVEDYAQMDASEPTPSSFSSQEQSVFADTPEDEVFLVSDAWENLRDSLSEDEAQALAIISQSGDIKAFADERGIMIEVLLDGINEKAADYIGDSLIDEDFVLYDDYIEPVKKTTRREC